MSEKPATLLERVLKDGGHVQGVVADVLGIDRARFNRLVKGKATPKLAEALAIERWSDRRVPVASWHEEEAA